MSSSEDVVREARREAAPALGLAIVVLVGLALVSLAKDWELLDRVPGWIWLVLAVPEVVLLLDLFIGNQLARSRRIALASLGVLAAFNSVGLLILAGGLTTTSARELTGGELLLTSFAILVTNVVVFALLFWELDDGGPVERRGHVRTTPDLQFPQDENRGLAPLEWRPTVWDYLYVSLTNSTAFSPTDAMPLTRRVKLLMAVESVVAITAVVLVTCPRGERPGLVTSDALRYVPPVAEGISMEELQLAARNHGMPLEALRWDITPVGLHYLLIHYDIPDVDAATWRLEVDGLLERPLSLSLDEIRARPAVEIAVTMECAGNGRAHVEPHVVSQPWLLEAVGTARWRGAPVAPLLDEAGLLEAANDVLFTGLDRGVEGGEEQDYARSLPLSEVLGGDAMLAYEINGQPLPPQHGFPLRLLVPGWYGMTSVKWLARVTVLDAPFDGYQMRRSYRFRQEEEEDGKPVLRMQPRALMVPPGIPDFLTRARVVEAGPCAIQGRAWSGEAEVAGVEVSADGGGTWAEAELDDGPLGQWAWRSWCFVWEAAPGEHELCCRARDTAGNLQPLEPPWNLGGYANNAVQRIPVTVTDDS